MPCGLIGMGRGYRGQNVTDEREWVKGGKMVRGAGGTEGGREILAYIQIVCFMCNRYLLLK